MMTTFNTLTGPMPQTPYCFGKTYNKKVLGLLKKHGHTILGLDYKLKNVLPQKNRQGLIEALSEYIFGQNCKKSLKESYGNDIFLSQQYQDKPIVQILKEIKQNIIKNL